MSDMVTAYCTHDYVITMDTVDYYTDRIARGTIDHAGTSSPARLHVLMSDLLLPFALIYLHTLQHQMYIHVQSISVALERSVPFSVPQHKLHVLALCI